MALDSFRQAYPHTDPQKFQLITNGFDLDFRCEVSELIAERRAPKHGHSLVMCHPGSMYGERDPRPVLEAMAKLREEGYHIRLQQIGHCNPEYNPRMIAKQLNLDDAVELIDQLPHAEVMKKMSQADLLLLIQPNAPFQVPGKLYEMLVYDQPIVAVCDSPPTERIVRDAGGFTAPSNDSAAIAQAIRQAAEQTNNPELREKRLNAQQQFDGDALTKRLANLLENLTCIITAD